MHGHASDFRSRIKERDMDNCPQLARIRKEYVDNGRTLHHIALMLNIHESTVYRRLRAAGIPITPRKVGGV